VCAAVDLRAEKQGRLEGLDSRQRQHKPLDAIALVKKKEERAKCKRDRLRIRGDREWKRGTASWHERKRASQSTKKQKEERRTYPCSLHLQRGRGDPRQSKERKYSLRRGRKYNASETHCKKNEAVRETTSRKGHGDLRSLGKRERDASGGKEKREKGVGEKKGGKKR